MSAGRMNFERVGSVEDRVAFAPQGLEDSSTTDAGGLLNLRATNPSCQTTTTSIWMTLIGASASSKSAVMPLGV
jgi:hypothetical protein